MPFSSLGEFLSALQDDGELIRIAAPVDSALELAAITDRVCKTSATGGPALLFENIRNSTIPVVTNLLGSQRRLCRAFGIADLDQLSGEFAQRLRVEQSGGWLESFRLLPAAGGLEKWTPKTVKAAPCQQVVRMGRDVNLWDVPIPRCWPGEQFPILTSGHGVARHSATNRNVFWRTSFVVTGQQELAWYDATDAERELVKSAAAAGQNLPVSISLGGDPILSALESVSDIDDIRTMSGCFQRTAMDVVRCRTNELEVPATSEFVIEGYVDATNPMSNQSLSIARGNGRYVRRPLPLIQVTAITQRANPILPAQIVAIPPAEQSWIGLAVDRMLLPIVQQQIPEIVDLHQPFSSARRNLLFVSIRKTVEYQARRVLHALWGLASIGRMKWIIVVDEDVDLGQEQQVWYAAGAHARPDRDFLFSDGHAWDDDYTSTASSTGQIGIDATQKAGNEVSVTWPDSLTMSVDIINRIQERWSEFGMREEPAEKRP